MGKTNFDWKWTDSLCTQLFGTHPTGKAYLTENKVTVYNSPMGRNNQTENEFAVYVPVLWTGTVLMRKN